MREDAVPEWVAAVLDELRKDGQATHADVVEKRLQLCVYRRLRAYPQPPPPNSRTSKSTISRVDICKSPFFSLVASGCISASGQRQWSRDTPAS